MATAKVGRVCLWFNDKSTQRHRAVHTVTAGLARSTFVAMTQLRKLAMCHLPLSVIKTIADRSQPLDWLFVDYPTGVNWVSVSVFCQCAHNTVLLVAVCSVGWLVSSDYCPIHCCWYCSTSGVVM